MSEWIAVFLIFISAMIFLMLVFAIGIISYNPQWFWGSRSPSSKCKPQCDCECPDKLEPKEGL